MCIRDRVITCDECGRYGRYQVYMTYMVLSLFFIPCFKWNRHYYVQTLSLIHISAMIVALVMSILCCVGLSHAFGKGAGFACGLIFLNVI